MKSVMDLAEASCHAEEALRVAKRENCKAEAELQDKYRTQKRNLLLGLAGLDAETINVADDVIMVSLQLKAGYDYIKPQTDLINHALTLAIDFFRTGTDQVVDLTYNRMVVSFSDTFKYHTPEYADLIAQDEVVFSLDLTEPYRSKKTITEMTILARKKVSKEQAKACIYYLLNLRKIKDVEAKIAEFGVDALL